MEKKSVSVTLNNVTKRFKNIKGKEDVIAVKGADFVVEGGEPVTLLGPSGCGKTTTLRMIAGFELPTKGSIHIGEEGQGYIDGRVKMNVYLGNSLESFIQTPFGELLVQIDDPHSKRVFPEGEEVSIDFSPDRVRLLAESEE